MKKIILLLLRKEIVKRLKKAHKGGQFIDDVLTALNLPAGEMKKYQDSLKRNADCIRA